ncbi:MAG: hypothetical protein ACI9Z7_001449, partial [Alteromonas macleodii]
RLRLREPQPPHKCVEQPKLACLESLNDCLSTLVNVFLTCLVQAGLKSYFCSPKIERFKTI